MREHIFVPRGILLKYIFCFLRKLKKKLGFFIVLKKMTPNHCPKGYDCGLLRSVPGKLLS